MRKIVQNLYFGRVKDYEDPYDFDLFFEIKMKDGDEIVQLMNGTCDQLFPGKYTFAESLQIEKINSLLTDKGYPVMTDEETLFAIRPRDRYQKPEPTPSDLQLLAGFKVEKIVTQTKNEVKEITKPIEDILLEHFKKCSTEETNWSRTHLEHIIDSVMERAKNEKDNTE